MLPLPHSRFERQIVFNRSFEIILNYEDPNGIYVDPTRLLNQDKSALEMSYEDAGRLVPFFEVLILRGEAGSYSYRLTLDGDNELNSKEWKKIGACFQEALSVFEKEKFGTKGQLFYDESLSLSSKKSDIRQEKYEIDFRLAQRLKNAYHELMATLSKMVEDGVPTAEIGKQFDMAETKVKLCLHETSSGKPTISPLALKILENSDTAKKLEIRDGQRLYDEIISRALYNEFPKRVRHGKSKRIRYVSTGPVQLYEDEY